MVDTIKTRLAARMNGETYNETILDELAQTILDRLSLRLGVTDETTFPAVFYSVVVDATVKAYRRIYYEGLTAETAGNVNSTFVADILEEYTPEITAYLDSHSADETCGADVAGRVVRFL